MKKILLPTLVVWLSGHLAIAGNWFGPGPWANATFFPGNLDGKYQAAVFGNNISGVLGFAIRDGAPTVSTNTTTTTTGGASGSSSTTSTAIVDPLQNYFVVFVEGRTYSGLTTAGINYDNNTVTGALLGSQPDFRLTTNSLASFTTNSRVEAGPPLDIKVPVTNVSQEIIQVGSNRVVLTDYTPLTNLVVSNLTLLTTNTVSTNETLNITSNIVQTNVITRTNEIVTTNSVTATNEVVTTNSVTATNEVVTTNQVQVDDNGSLVWTNTYTTNYTTTNFSIFSTNLVVTNFDTFSTNLVITNDTILTTNVLVTETNVWFTNDVVTTTNVTLTNSVETSPTLTTNFTPVFVTNFITNITFETVASNTFITNPAISQLTNSYTWFDPTTLLNRGLSGGYRANISSKRNVFTFNGDGQLSTPSQVQTILLTTNSRGDVTSAQVQTGTVAFQLTGIRVSFSPGSTAPASAASGASLF